MTRTRIAILGACGVIMVWTLLSLLLLLYGNDWWLSGLTTLTVFAWLAGLLVVMFQQGRIRAAATGAVIAAAAYWLLALGPWFSTNVGPTLLTSRGLAHLDVLLHGNLQQTQTLTWAMPQSATAPVYLTGSGIVTPGTIQTNLAAQTTLAFINSTTVTSGVSVFQSMGQWLTIWLCAALGSLAAILMQRRSARKHPRTSPIEPPATPAGAAS
jgi:hypothetical protein